MNPQDIRTLVNRLTLLEAGEPTNPSRRGFLKKAAGAAAMAAAPGSLLKGIGSVASTAAGAGANSMLGSKLFQAALMHGMQTGFGNEYTHGSPNSENEKGDWWDETLETPQGESGKMPWGGNYNIQKSPLGTPYLFTDDTGEYGQLTFVDEHGKIQSMVFGIDRPDPYPVVNSTTRELEDRYQRGIEYMEEPIDDFGKLVDVLTGKIARYQGDDDHNDDHNDEFPTDAEKEKSTDDSATSALGRFGIRAALTKLGNMVLSQNKNKESLPPTASVSDTPSKPLALPPPSKSEYDDLLTPNLDKEKPEYGYWKPGEEENPEQLKKKKQ
jgi:hypothetical protein